jgi:hypothetical protein
VADAVTRDDEAKIVALMRSARARARGYADFFLWSIDRDMEEWGVVMSLAESLEADDDLFFTSPRRRGRPNDPPDCEATDNVGGRIAIEVTELVDEAAIRAYKAGEIYNWAEWDKTKFLSALVIAIGYKNRKFPKLKGGPYNGGYVVVIHTDEPMLGPDIVAEFLTGHVFDKPTHIDRVYLLLSYDPSRERCPYFELTLCG